MLLEAVQTLVAEMAAQYAQRRIRPGLFCGFGVALQQAGFTFMKRTPEAVESKGWWYRPGDADLVLAYPGGDAKDFYYELHRVALRLRDTGRLEWLVQHTEGV